MTVIGRFVLEVYSAAITPATTKINNRVIINKINLLPGRRSGKTRDRFVLPGLIRTSK